MAPSQPIALVGRSLRFPGASSASELCELLRRPRDLLEEFPPLRMNLNGYYHPDGSRRDTTNVRQSYFVAQDHRVFDAPFFKISPVEAEAMDPQQRILLELVYEALESAGMTIDGLQRSRTSVYVGVMSSDFSTIQQRDGDTMPTYAVTGTASSILSNRISYFFDWKGASMTIDTACSSSLVALHEAVQSLRNGESDIAIVAGTNLMLTPEPFITESTLGMLSPTSRSRMWDAQADGYVRGEGFAVVVLKSLDRAFKDNDPIRSIVRESLVNTDGRTTGITVPNAAAQATLIRETYQRAGLDCQREDDRCQYFEAHGTGTPTGDPVEAEAIATAFFPSTSSPTTPLHVGSVKTVVGHLEGCAGLAGLLKASLAVEKGLIFPNMHFNKLNPTIEPFYRHLKIPLAAEPWPEVAPGNPRRASVNSFGFGGANAHVILESYEPPTDGPDERSLVPQLPGPLVISAQSPSALATRVRSLSQYLQSHPSVDLDSLAAVLQSHRTVFNVRASFVGATADGLVEFMDSYVQKAPTKSPNPRGARDYPRLLGIFTGQGAQWPQMGHELILTSPVFAESLSTLQRSLDALPDPPSWSLREELLAETDVSRVHEPAVGQPLCTAVQIGLVDLLRVAGLKFSKVVGHSSGEIAAAYAAGFFTAVDALRISYYRGMHVGNNASSSGAMAAVQMGYREAQDLCQSSRFAGRVVVAASNSPSSVTLSGDADAIQDIKEVLEATTPVKQLHVDQAYHSHHMLSVAEPYAKSLRACNIQVLPGRPDCTWISSVRPDATTPMDGLPQESYWVENLTQPVLFSQAVTSAVSGHDTIDAIFEVGPHPALRTPTTQTIRESGGPAIPYYALLQRARSGGETFAAAIGDLWVSLGADAHIDFVGYRTAFGRKMPSAQQQALLLSTLPTYPWDHERVYWKESRISANSRLNIHSLHCLLGRRRPDDSPHDMRWRNILRLNDVSWLRGHTFQGEVVFPAAGYVSMAVDACQSLVPEGRSVGIVEIRDLEISHALVLHDDSAGMEVLFSLQVQPSSDPNMVIATFACVSGPNKADSNFRLNAQGKVLVSLKEVSAILDDALPPRYRTSRAMLAINSDQLYRTLSGLGLEYKGLFRALSDVQRTTKMSSARALWLSSELDRQMRVHPAVLDTGFQAVFASAGSIMSLHQPYLPTRIAKIRVGVAPIDHIPEPDVKIDIDTYITMVSHRSSDGMPIIKADLDIFSDCQYRVQVEGLALTPMSVASPANDRILYYQTVWEDDVSSMTEIGMLETIPRRKGSLDDTELPELLERLAHVYLRELHASVSSDKIPTLEWYHQRLFEYMDDLFADIDQGRHPIIKPQWAGDTRQQLRAEISLFPETIDLICANTVAKHMPEALASKSSMLEMLAENDKLTRLYDEGLMVNRIYDRAAQITQQLSHRYPRLRILEIGAGTGATTGRVLEGLQGAFSTYAYTDVSHGFFEKARTRFAQWAGKMEFRTFNVERDPGEQGLPLHSYDLVIASAVLHATRFVRKSLAHARRLLKPGGYLLLLEPTSRSLRVVQVMCGLPGWWLGGEDGRRLHPGLSPIQWDSALKDVGFSGVDTLCSDSNEPSKHIYSLMTAQALNEKVVMLREPLSALSSLPEPTQLLIIGGKTLPVCRITSEISLLLRQWRCHIVTVPSLEALASSVDVLQGAIVLCLSDLDRPIFQTMTPTIFRGLQKLFNNAQKVLWVTSECHTDGPYSHMMLGLIRVLYNEMAHLDVQLLDLQDSHPRNHSQARDITHALLRLIMKDFLGNEILWSTEPELVLRDGKLRIPRLRPDNLLNNRMNSSWRRIHTSVSTEAEVVQLSFQHGQWSLSIQESLPSWMQGIAGEQTIAIQMELCSLHPIEICQGISLYVGIGRVLATGQKIVALASSNASFAKTRANWTWAYELPCDEERQFLQSIIIALLSRRILSVMAKDNSLLLAHSSSSRLIAQMVIQLSQPRRVQVLCVTSQDYLPKDGHNWLHIHPNATIRQASTIVPRNLTQVFSLAVESEDEVIKRTLSCLSSSVETTELSAWLPDRPQAQAEGNESEIESLMDMVIREAQVYLHSTAMEGNFTVLLPSSVTAGGNHPRTSIVDWRGEVNYPLTVRPLSPSDLLSGDKTYFLVGLTGELGRSLAEWMIGNGARYLAMSSRRGVVDADWLDKMHASGAHVRVFAMDVTDAQALKSVHEEIKRTMPCVGGVVNGAMVLADALLADMTFEALVTALRPKVDGSRNLDVVFRGPELDFFILFSSVSAVTGFQGQSNYAAANMFMAGLAAQRRAQGLVGSVLDLGMLVEVGYVARAGLSMQDYLQRKYQCPPIYEPDFHQMFAEAIVAGHPDSTHPPEIITGIQALQVSQIAERPPWLDNPRFSHLFLEDATTEEQVNSSQGTSIAQIMTNSETRDEAISALETELIDRLATVLQTDPSEVNPRLPLVNIGVDSLIAIEIRSWLIRQLQVDIPALRMVSGITLIDLIDDVATKFLGSEDIINENGLKSSSVGDKGESVDLAAVGKVDNDEEMSDSRSGEVAPSLFTGETGESATIETQSHATSDNFNIVAQMIEAKDQRRGRDVTVSPTDQDDLSKDMLPKKAEMPSDIVLSETLSYSQARQWFLVASSDTPARYNVVLAYDIDGALNIARFQQAFQSVIARHQAFRTCFYMHATTGEGTQGILQKSRSSLNFKVVASEDEIQEEFDRIKNYAFQLEQGEVFLATLLQQSPSKNTLVFGYSHILMDGTSVFLFLDDLDKAYRGAPSETPPRPYTDFSVNQRALVENKHLRGDFNHWKKILSPLPPVLPLLDIGRVRSRPPTSTGYGTHTVHAKISGDDVLNMRKRCQELGITAFHFHLTVLHFLLSKFLVTTNDYCVGIADANRLDESWMRTIGNFFNLLPLRFYRPAEQQKFREAAKETSQQVLSALSHSRLPFELLLEELDIPRSVSSTPLFQVFMNYRMSAFQHQLLGDCQMHHRAVSDANLGYDLFVTVTEPTRTSCVVSMTVRDDLYTQEAAQLLINAYCHLLGQVVQDPSQTLQDYTLFKKTEAQSSITLGQGPQQDCLLQGTLPHQVEAWSRKAPNRVAVRDMYGNTLSFDALNKQGCSLARALSTNGITKGVYVAVLMHPCSITITSLLAIVRLGAIYVPLDLSNPPERLARIVRDCNPAAIICQQNTVRLAEEMVPKEKVVVLNQTSTDEVDNDVLLTDDFSHLHEPAFTLYTSGSTGSPKGVLITQANFLHAVDATRRASETTDSDIILQQSSLGFDLSLYQIVHALACGATLVMVPSALRRNPRALAKVMLEQRITITIATPSEYSIMLAYGMHYLQQCTAWRVAAFSGENMGIPVKQLFQQLHSPDLAIQNWFGPTEVGVYAIDPKVPYHDIGDADPEEYPSIRGPAPNMNVYIVDEQLQPLAPGFPGEICVGGPNTTMGYVGDPDLTLRKFVPNHLTTGGGPTENRLYRSGDKGRLLTDGIIVFLGRMEDDSMAKLRGFRFDLNEVANSILHAGGGVLTDAAATLRGYPPSLIAFVVVSPDQTLPDVATYLENLASNLPLPDYMCPSIILPLSALPTTPNGKRDRAALDLIPLPMTPNTQNEMPLSHVAASLKELWLRLLPSITTSSQIHHDTGFFRVGGSSILLIKLQALIQETFQVKITVLKLFQFNTLGGMAASIEANLRQQQPVADVVDNVPEIAREGSPTIVHAPEEAFYPMRLLPLSFDVDIDWEDETALQEELQRPLSRQPRALPLTGRVVLLTGSTGLLGRALLARLIEDPSVSKVHCVAVPLLSEFRHTAKVTSYVGSLAMPSLGLSPGEMEMLAEEVDLTIHASVEGSFLDSYQTVRQSTLGAVRCLVAIAAPRRIPFHFVSSSRVLLFTGAPSLREISVTHFQPPTDGSEGLAASRWACERYLENAAEELAVPVHIHRCCAMTSDKAPPSDVLNSIIRYTRLLKAVPVLEKTEGFIDFMPLEATADEIADTFFPSTARDWVSVRVTHHTSGNHITPVQLQQHFENEESCPFAELELTEWLERAQEVGLCDFAVAVLDSLRSREEPVFFPLLLKTTSSSQDAPDDSAARQAAAHFPTSIPPNGSKWAIEALTPRTVYDIYDQPIDRALRQMLQKDFLSRKTSPYHFPAALMYDSRGLQLWNDCTYLPDYYLTTGEIKLLEEWSDEIIDSLGPNCALVDLGSANLRKVRCLLGRFEQRQVEVYYFALDLSRTELERCMENIPIDWSYVKCFGICGTFNDAQLWSQQLPVHKCFLSLGATFGNDSPDQSTANLARWAAVMTAADRMILGMDACQDPDRVFRAYNDVTGVWYRFIRNGFEHSNRVLESSWYRPDDWDLSGEFDESGPHHHFILRAKGDVHCPALGLHFSAGEEIVTYPSYKYHSEELDTQFSQANMKKEAIWKDPRDNLHLYFLSVAKDTTAT